jgi:hypothetical protein
MLGEQKHKIIYDRLADDERSLVYIFPKKTTLAHRLGTDDALFIDFVSEWRLRSCRVCMLFAPNWLFVRTASRGHQSLPACCR